MQIAKTEEILSMLQTYLWGLIQCLKLTDFSGRCAFGVDRNFPENCYSLSEMANKKERKQQI